MSDCIPAHLPPPQNINYWSNLDGSRTKLSYLARLTLIATKGVKLLQPVMLPPRAFGTTFNASIDMLVVRSKSIKGGRTLGK